MEPDVFLTVAFGLVVLGFLLYLFRFYRKEPDYSDVPELFKEELPHEEEEDDEE